MYVGLPCIERKWGELPIDTEEDRCHEFFNGDLIGVEQHLDHIKVSQVKRTSNPWDMILRDRNMRGCNVNTTESGQTQSKRMRSMENEDVSLVGHFLLLTLVMSPSFSQELGATSVYLNPIFTSKSNHKYDTIDYFQVSTGDRSETDEIRIHF